MPIGDLPDLSNRHGLLHVVVEDVTCLPSESVEDSDCAITMSSSDIFVIGVESDAESLLRGVTQSVFVCNFDIRVLYHLQTTWLRKRVVTQKRPRGESDCPPPWPYRSSFSDCCCF